MQTDMYFEFETAHLAAVAPLWPPGCYIDSVSMGRTVLGGAGLLLPGLCAWQGWDCYWPEVMSFTVANVPVMTYVCGRGKCSDKAKDSPR